MNPYVKYPTINPIRMFQDGVGRFFYDAIPPMEQANGYQQPFNYSDILHLQFQTVNSKANISAAFYDIEGVQVSTVACDKIPGTVNYPGYYQYKIYTDFSLLTEGFYELRVTFNIAAYDPIVFRSEPLHVKAEHEDTILIQYTHPVNDFDILFTADQDYFNLRIKGGLPSDGYSPGGKFSMFEDFDYTPKMLQAIPFDVWKFTFGGNYGLPNYLVQKINLIFALKQTFINGSGYMRNEGAKLEAIERDHFYPLTAWTMELLANPLDYVTPGNFTEKTVDLMTLTVDDLQYHVDQLYI